jgi:DNA end-binding protein Ku
MPRPWLLLARDAGSLATGGLDHRWPGHPEVPGERLDARREQGHADEVRDFRDVEKGEHIRVVEAELTLAKRLIAGLAAEAFEPAAYKDTYRERVLALVEQKAAGREVIVAPEAASPPATLDLMDALKRSLERKPPIKAALPTGPGKPPVDLAQARARRKKRAQAS